MTLNHVRTAFLHLLEPAGCKPDDPSRSLRDKDELRRERDQPRERRPGDRAVSSASWKMTSAIAVAVQLSVIASKTATARRSPSPL